jgi:hypothetical protein
MTDIAVLAHDVTTHLIPALPYLVKIGEGAATETGKKLLGGAWDTTKALWDKLWTKVEAKPAALEAAQDLAANPNDADSQATLRNQLKKLLSEDQSFATEIEQLFNKAKEVGGSQVSATHDGIAFGDNAKDNIAITGGVHGDFVIGDKHKS